MISVTDLITTFIHSTTIQPQSLPKDLQFDSTNEWGDPIIGCKVCNSLSGSWLQISHKPGCLYRAPNPPTLRFTATSDSKFTNPPEKIVSMFQPPLTVNASMMQGSIGSFGAGPCIILAFHRPDTRETTMVHLDALTGDMMTQQMIHSFGQSSVDVYICGGDSASIDQQVRLLEMLQGSLLNITYKLIHLNDYNTNSLTIDSQTDKWSMNDLSFDPSTKQWRIGNEFKSANLIQSREISKPLKLYRNSTWIFKKQKCFNGKNKKRFHIH